MESLYFSIKLSLFVASLSTLMVAISGSLIGYFLARFNFTGRNLLDAFFSLPMILPPTVVGFYLLGLFGKQGFIGKYLFTLTGWSPVFTWQAAVIAAYVISLPLMIKTSRAAFESVDKNLENMSYTLGKSKLTTFLEITLPLASKGLLAGIALSFARAIGEFGATLMLAGNIPGKTQTISMAIFSASIAGEYQETLLLVLILSLLSLVLLMAINNLGYKWQKN